MISGLSSPGGYFPQPVVSKAKTASPQTPQAQPEDLGSAAAAEVRAPTGNERALTREFNLFDLAHRQFSELLPRLEGATSPLE